MVPYFDYLPEVAGLTFTLRPDFVPDEQRWTTCGLAHLERGEVFSLPRPAPFHPVVLTEINTVVEDGYDWVVGEARYVDSGEPVEFRFRATTSVLTRCDSLYTAGGRA